MVQRMTEKDKSYEIDIKGLVLDHPHLFGNIGSSEVVFEKAISKYSVIADCLIFSSNLGVIGVEIKTGRDSTRRLNKQLFAYEKICDFVYVFCHETKVAGVEKILDNHNHPDVGLITYAEYNGETQFGKIRDSNTSAHYDARELLNVLWKTELLRIARSASLTTHQLANMDKSLVVSVPRHAMQYVPQSLRGNLSKRAIIDYIMGLFGPLGATQIVVDMYIEGTHDPAKLIKTYHIGGV
ncbi:hypothetical protein [Brochothrix phage BtpYZU04]